jgi:hypothetical protein
MPFVTALGQFLADNPGPRRDVAGYVADTGYSEGQTIGLTGRRTGISRGTISDTWYAPSGSKYPSYTYGYVRVAPQGDFCPDGGDSGGAIWRNEYALGLHSGSSGCYGVFSRIAYPLDEFNVGLVTW